MPYHCATFCNLLSNKLICSWMDPIDVSKVENMESTRLYADVLYNPVGSWYVSMVTDLGYLFLSAQAFNNLIGTWDVGKVATLSVMFSRIARGALVGHLASCIDLRAVIGECRVGHGW